MMHPDDQTVRWVPETGPPRRLRFRPAADGVWRCEEIWNGCTWREIGRELVSDVAIEA